MPAPVPFRTHIIAHRGASHDAPENTLAAATLGWSQGADGVECDIHDTQDNRLAVIHDDTVQRTTGTAGRVESLTLEALQRLDAGQWKGARFAGETIPSLEAWLHTVPPGKLAVVEVKTTRDISPLLQRAFATSGLLASQVVLIGFDYEVMRRIKQDFPAHEALWLISGTDLRERTAVEAALDDLIQRCRDAGLDGLDIWQGWPIDRAFVEKIHQARLKLAVYTVNEPAVAQALADAQVDYLTTDRPGLIRECLLERFKVSRT